MGSCGGPSGFLGSPWAVVWLLGRFGDDFQDFPGNFGRPFGTMSSPFFVFSQLTTTKNPTKIKSDPGPTLIRRQSDANPTPGLSKVIRFQSAGPNPPIQSDF